MNYLFIYISLRNKYTSFCT